MFRAGVTKHLRSAAAQASLVSAPVMGPRVRPAPLVDIDSDQPMSRVLVRKAGSEQTVSLREVAEQLVAVANATRADALSAPAIGYDARIVVVKSGLDTRVLINPEITGTSQATTTTWDADGDMVHRVLRPRNVSVKYTTLEGDEEEWYDLAASESLWLQRVLDGLDGINSAERLAPCVAKEPSLYPSVVSHGVVSSMSRALYETYKGHLSLLVDAKALQRCLA